MSILRVHIRKQVMCLQHLLKRPMSCEKVVKGLVLGLYESEKGEPKLTPTAEKFDDRLQGKIQSLVKDTNMTGKLGDGTIFGNLDNEYRHIAIIGLGPEGIGYNEDESIEEGMENVRVAAGVGARKLQLHGCTEVHVDSMESPEQAAEGSAIAIFRYQDNKRKQSKVIMPKLELFESPDVDAWTRGLFKAEAQNLARRLTDAPANQMTPTAFAQAAVDALSPCGVTVDIRTINWIEQNKLNSFLAIAKGSCEPPIFLEISYCGTSPDERPICLVGKGMTFNSGGLCLKKSYAMDRYRGSMAGAAVVVAAIRASAALSLPVNIVAAIPLCENMPSGLAIKAGDVITLLNGRTLAVDRTDKAGVVAMADPLIYAQSAYKPKMVIDVATGDTGVKDALGGGACGVFTNANHLWQQIQQAGVITGDRMWRFPLWRYYRRLVVENTAFDLNNRGRGPAKSAIAAALLHEFCACTDWMHLDITGVGMLSDLDSVPYLLKMRMTGRPTRTLIQFLYQMACPEK